MNDRAQQQRWLIVKEIWAEAIALPADARDAFIDARCGADRALVDELRQLLDADRADAFLDPPDPSSVARTLVQEERDPLLGVTLGAYRVQELLASGGMGNVYKAGRDDAQLRQEVAIKVLKRGLDTEDILDRFRYERDVLAGLNHPGIAGIFDAGSTPDGRPYFVMPYVAGSTLTQYCDAQQMSVPDRIALFIQLCEAVQYAHHKGVIHRDLKPGNVLVDCDSAPRPVIIDFGIARAVEVPRGRERTVHGSTPLGTPAYMSPEQADPLRERVDTRTDVFSLGMILYKLLIGVLPTSSGHRAGPLPPMSTRFQSLPDKERIAASRSTSVRDLLASVRGELDWIGLKALAHDPGERYSAVADLVTDLADAAMGRAVSVGPPSPAYRIRKWIGCHQTIAALLTVLLIVMVAGAAGTAIGLVRARRAESSARQEARMAQAINEFLHEALAAANPYAGSADVTVRDMVDEAAARIDQNLAEHPATQVAVRRTIARTYSGLGLFESAALHLRKALALGIDRHAVAVDLAEVLHRMGNDTEAAELARSVLPHYESNGPLAASARTAIVLGDVLTTLGHQDEAEQMYRQALRWRRQVHNPAELSHVLTRLGLQQRTVGDYAEAETLLTEAVELLGERGDLIEGETLRHLGFVMCDQGRFSDATPMLRRALDLHRRGLPAHHDTLARVLNDLAMVEKNNGHYAAAEELYREALEIHIDALGPDHREVAITRNNLAAVLARQHMFEESCALYRQALGDMKRLFGADHLFVATTQHNLGAVFLAMGDVRAADIALQSAYDLRRDQLDADHPHVAISLVRLAELRVMTGDLAQAEHFARQALRIRQHSFSSAHWTIGEALGVLGAVLLVRGQHQDGEHALVEASQILHQAVGAEHPEARKVDRRLALYYESRAAAEVESLEQNQGREQ